MKKNLLAFLVILFSFVIVKGQDNLVINLTDNNSITVGLSQIQKITFDSDNLLLKTITGTESSYMLDNITSITFLTEVGIKQFTEETIDVHVFVNGSGEIVVETPLQISKLTVFDLTGRQVAASTQSKLNVTFLTAGIYILQVTTDNGIVSKKFIRNR